MITRQSLITTALILLIGFGGYFMALNEQAYEKCLETHSVDTCRHTIK